MSKLQRRQCESDRNSRDSSDGDSGGVAEEWFICTWNTASPKSVLSITGKEAIPELKSVAHD